jgi:SAM-dependent methyltransferase
MYDMVNNNREFNWVRSELYKKALEQYPQARKSDIKIMENFLTPKKDQTILEVWAGSWFFSGSIADRCKKLFVSDPSADQLEEVRKLDKTNVDMIEWWAEEINLPENSVDVIRSFGAMHHCLNKIQAFKNFQKILRPWWRLVIVDVLSWSDLAKHFDNKVAKYCISWHEVAFLSKEYFDSLCFSVGLKNISTKDLDIKWEFKREEDIGDFLYKLHAMTKTSIEECLQWAKDILWVTSNALLYCLNRPLTVFIAEK